MDYMVDSDVMQIADLFGLMFSVETIPFYKIRKIQVAKQYS